MRLQQLYDALKIFSGAFNQRPQTELFFNEKLFTKQQLEDYEQALETIKRSIAKQEAKRKQELQQKTDKHCHQWDGQPDTNQIALFNRGLSSEWHKGKNATENNSRQSSENSTKP